jgi:glycopeptide antibiotics resistance protein
VPQAFLRTEDYACRARLLAGAISRSHTRGTTVSALLEWAARIVPWVVLAVIVISLFAIPVYLWRARRTSRIRAAAWTVADGAVLAALVTVLAFTLRPGDEIDGGIVLVNLVPFRDFLHSLDLTQGFQRVALGNLLGNVLLFMPWGAALALRWRRLGFFGVLVVTACLSSGIEIWQAVSRMGRMADVTDVLMNTLGGIVGYALLRILLSLQHHRRAGASPTI